MSCGGACPDEAKLRKALAEVFDEIDTSGEGFVDEKELENLMEMGNKRCGKPVDKAKIKQDAQAFLKEVDRNRDGKIAKDEFIQYVIKHCK